MTAVRAVLGRLLGVFVKLWIATLRVQLHGTEYLQDAPSIVLAFFHGRQFPLLAWKLRRATCVLVSHSHDGTLQAGSLSALGFEVIRGSSTRGGALGARGMIRSMRKGLDAAIAVDGPKGPHGAVKDGVFLLARAARAAIVPMGGAASSAWILRRAWDRFLIPKPFARVHIFFGPPLTATATAHETACAIEAMTVCAIAAATRD